MTTLCRRFARPAAAALAANTAFEVSTLCQRRRGVSPAVHEELHKLRAGEEAMRRRWEEDEDKWHQLPPRAWPAYYPTSDELPTLRQRLMDEDCPAFEGPSLSQSCVRKAFDLATCLTFNGLDTLDGFRVFKVLGATHGDAEAMVAVGVLLMEGIGVPRDEVEGLRWVQRAAGLGNAQGEYELAVAYYTGLEKTLECDESAAFRLFERSSSQSHTGALFMIADCLLDGVGCEADPARAVPLLHQAAERGHRLARAYLLEWLDEDMEMYRGTQ